METAIEVKAWYYAMNSCEIINYPSVHVQQVAIAIDIDLCHCVVFLYSKMHLKHITVDMNVHGYRAMEIK